MLDGTLKYSKQLNISNILLIIMMVTNCVLETTAQSSCAKDSLYQIVLSSQTPIPDVLIATTELYKKNFEISGNIVNHLDDLILKNSSSKRNQAILLEAKVFYYLYQHEIKNAEHVLEKSLEYYKQSGEKNLKSVYMKLGAIKNENGKNVEALAFYLKAVELAKMEKDDKILGNLYFNIGNLQHDLCNVGESEKYYQSALDLSYKTNDMFLAANANMSLGLNAMDANQLDDAKIKIEKSIHLFDSLGSDGYYTAINNLAIIYEASGETTLAMQIYKKLERHFAQDSNNLGLANVQYDMGVLQEKLGNYDEAVLHCTASKNLYLVMGSSQDLKECYFCLYTAAKKSGKTAEALNYFENYVQYSDSVTKYNNLQEIGKIQKDFDFKEEKEELEIENAQKIEKEKYSKRLLSIGLLLLVGFLIIAIRAFVNKQKTNKIITKQKEELEQYNLANENLIFSLSHDIREPMLGVQLLLKGIQSDDATLKNAKLSIESQISSINSIVSNLLQIKKMSFVDQKESCNLVEIQSVVMKLITQSRYKLEEKQLTIHNQVDANKEISLPISTQKLFLVLLNLLNNAIKFSPNHSTIDIWLENDGVFIKDNGPGISSEILDKIGKENIVLDDRDNSHFGMGLVLVRNMLMGSKMTLVFKNHDTGGTIAGLTMIDS